MARVDRTYENDPEDSCVTVTLDDGFQVHFWLSGLTDAEYILRTKQIQVMEKEEVRREKELLKLMSAKGGAEP